MQYGIFVSTRLFSSGVMNRQRKESHVEMELITREMALDGLGHCLPVELHNIVLNYEMDLLLTDAMLKSKQKCIYTDSVLTQFKRLPRYVRNQPSQMLLQLCQRHADRAQVLRQLSTLTPV